MLKIKTSIFMVCLLVLSVTALAVDIENPSVVDSMFVEITQRGNVTLGNSGILLTLDLYIPQNTDFQEVEILEVSTDNYERLVDEHGNEYLQLSWKNPSELVEFFIISKVNIRRSEEVNVGDEIFYSNPTDLVDSDHPAVIAQAEKIILGKKTDFDKIAEMTKWVNTKLEYDLDYKNVNLSASQTLNNERGVCSEYSVLFQGLARAVGFETRSALGWVISQYEPPFEFQPHSWSEVKIDGNYIPVDSTWGATGIVDATHIKFSTFPDSIFREATAKVTSTRNIGSPIIKMETAIRVISFTEDPIVEAQSKVLDDQIWDGSVVVKTNLKANNCVLLKIRAVSCGNNGQFFFDVENQREVIYFCNERDHYSIFNLATDLKDTTVYTCPISIIPSLGDIQTINVTMKKAFDSQEELELAVSEDSVLPGEQVLIESPGADIFTSTGLSSQNSLQVFSQEDFIVYAYKNGNLMSQEVDIIAIKPFSLSISANETMIKGKEYEVEILVENLLDSSQKINIELGNITDSIQLSGKSDHTFKINTTAESAVIQVFADNEEFSTSSAVSVNLLIRKDLLGMIADFFNQILMLFQGIL